MTGFDWLAATALFLTFVFTLVRTEILNPRLGWAPSAPFLERLAYDLLAVGAGLRGWIIFSDVQQASPSEVWLSLALALVACIGCMKILWRAVMPRLLARILPGAWI